MLPVSFSAQSPTITRLPRQARGLVAPARFVAPVGCVRFHTADTCIWQTDTPLDIV